MPGTRSAHAKFLKQKGVRLVPEESSLWRLKLSGEPEAEAAAENRSRASPFRVLCRGVGTSQTVAEMDCLFRGHRMLKAAGLKGQGSKKAEGSLLHPGLKLQLPSSW